MARQVLVAAVLGAALAALLPASPASAKQTEVLIASRAWYAQEQQEVGGDVGNIGIPSQSLSEGQLALEVKLGDYKTPKRIAAVAFDFATLALPPNSEVQRFTATFREADDPQARNPYFTHNQQGKMLRACLLPKVFGEGDYRPYKEAPKYTCPKNAPTARRKEVKKGQTSYFEWTFDLTSYARNWVKKAAFVTNVMITPAPPKDPAPADRDWGVVLEGTSQKNGIATTLVYEPGELPTFDPPDDDGGSDPPVTPPVTSGGGGVAPGGDGPVSNPATNPGGGGGFGGSPETTSGGGGAPAGGGGGGGGPSNVDLTTDTAKPAAADKPPEIESLPPYVWLALLAGVVAVSLMRRAVLGGAAGIRPDGVLAQIQRMNAERRGGEAAVDAGSGTSFGDGLRALGRGARRLIGKLSPSRKG